MSLDAQMEGKSVARETEDYLIFSTTDLHKSLTTVQALWHQADATIGASIQTLRFREKQAIQC